MYERPGRIGAVCGTIHRTALAFVVLLPLVVGGCGSSDPTADSTPIDTPAPSAPAVDDDPSETGDRAADVDGHGRVESVTIESAAIAGAMLDQNPAQGVNVYLPPGYDSDETRRFPVIYFLNGFGESNRQLMGHRRDADHSIVEGGLPGFIVVEPNGNGSLGGSFFWNSPVSGDWEDFVTDEVVGHVDANYRTIASRDGRGIAGFSMGGTGAINIALGHPDEFAAVYAFSPGLLAEGDLPSLLDAWGSAQYVRAYAAAASPNPSLTPPYEIPHETHDDDAENARVIDNWYSIFGDLSHKLDAYLAAEHRLDAIRINVREDDRYQWIYDGAVELSMEMDERGIDHVLDVETGGHRLPPNFVSSNLFPFFAEHLST